MNDPRFDDFFSLLMILEGPQDNNPHDRGGETKFGITKPTIESYNRRFKKNLDMKTLTRFEAKEIYYEVYFKEIKPTGNDFADYLYFDLCVNSGLFYYHNCLAQCGNDPSKIINWRKNYYAILCKKIPSQEEFLKGWLNRLNIINGHFSQANSHA